MTKRKTTRADLGDDKKSTKTRHLQQKQALAFPPAELILFPVF